MKPHQPKCKINFFLFIFCLPLIGTANTRFHQYTRQYHSPNDAATPLASGYIGGSGDEYLSGAAFLPNGTLLLAGNAFGPTFDPAGVQVNVLGEDGPAPDFNMPMRNNSPNPPNWQHTQGAGFITVLSPEYDRILGAVRFPWGSGTLTDIVADGSGGIYVTGIPGDRFSALTQSRPAAADGVSGPHDIFFGKMRSDLSGFEWCLMLKDSRDGAPTLRLLKDGNIGLLGANAYHFSPDGEILRATTIGYTNSWVRGVDFESHAEARGGDGNTNTGWEPWRQPSFQIISGYPDRQGAFSFYRWDAQFVGTNWSRLVSDSSTRTVAFDRNGETIVYAWSDGGNSVMAHVPYDLTRNVREAIKERTGRETGLPFSTWGAGVGSFAHINKLETETGEPLAYTLFIAYLADRNAPSSVSIDMLDTAVDNSLLLSGGSAFGLIETGSTKVNTLDIEAGDYIGGRFIAILDEPWRNIRFSSAIPGGGEVDIRRHSRGRNANIATESIQIGDKTRVVFVGGATQHDKFKPVNNAQSAFGGGTLDGQYVVLEMDTLPPLPDYEPQYPTSGRRTAGAGETQEGLEGLYIVNQGMNRDHSVLALRDTTAKKWPKFYRAHPKGEGLVDAQGRGKFTLLGTSDRVQVRGGAHQDKRLGGTHGSDEYPDLEIQVTLTGNATANAVVSYQGRTLELNGPISIRDSRPSGRGINLRGVFTTTKGALGLDDDPDNRDDEILIEFWAPGRPAPDHMRMD
ncbi:MAG: hypothetical protein JJU29_13960 [Verrucomicrobia bacterium]|nr:hypothetical protein [Verrucomicrobiota bacterium]MCH8510084.1 hypothetical protein [Kiritimatiellia bacterium]